MKIESLYLQVHSEEIVTLTVNTDEKWLGAIFSRLDKILKLYSHEEAETEKYFKLNTDFDFKDYVCTLGIEKDQIYIHCIKRKHLRERLHFEQVKTVEIDYYTGEPIPIPNDPDEQLLS